MHCYCSTYGIDGAIAEEFRATVEAYQTPSLDDIHSRVVDRYTGHNPTTYSIVLCVNGESVGHAFWGEKRFMTARMERLVNGINLSAWLLQGQRGHGLGATLIKEGLTHIIQDHKFVGYPIWTSIDRKNVASQKACQRAGFFLLGMQADKPERDIFLHEQRSAIGQPATIVGSVLAVILGHRV
jgi:hypothetical protein